MSAAAILKYRQEKYYTLFSCAEISFVSAHTKLSQSAKLLWINLNNATQGDKALKVRLTLTQMGKLINRSARRVSNYLQELIKLGFLKVLESDLNGTMPIHAISLPMEGLGSIDQAPNRGEAFKSQATFFAPTHDKNDVPPTSEMTTLYNINNNINNHMSVSRICEKTNPIAEEPKLSSDLLQGELLAKKHSDLFHNKYAHIESRLERTKAIDAEFSDSENELLLKFYDYQDRQSHIQQTKSESSVKQAPVQTVAAAINPSEQINIMGESFSVEPGLKKLVYTQIPKLVAQGAFQGRAANLSTSELQQEALFYATKAGTKTGKLIDQRHRFFVFCKLCKQGVWEQPKGMLNREIEKREQQWSKQKDLERQNAKRAMGQFQPIRQINQVASAFG